MIKFEEISYAKPYMQKVRATFLQSSFPFMYFGKRIENSGYHLLGIIKNQIAEWAFEEEMMYSFAAQFAAKLYDKRWFDEAYDKWFGVCKRIEALSRGIKEKNLQKLPEETTKALFEELDKAITEFWRDSFFIDMFDSGYDIKEIEKINKEFQFGKNEIQILLSPTKKSYVQENKLLLYDLAENYSEEKKQEFLDKFFWIKTDYFSTGRYLEKDLKKEIRELKKADWKKEKQGLIESMRALEEKQKQILESKGLKENPFWFYNELTFWRDERKRYNYMSLFAETQIAMEILKRKKIGKFMQVTNKEEVFNPPAKETLEKRLKNGIAFVISGGKFLVYEETDAEKRFHETIGLRETKGDLRGMSASIGTATGRVRIILTPKEFAKMQQGDILVTHMTRPEFVPILKRAAAIVTDEGGITCHAAIVARELRIPCVVGTQIATKVLKDNDLVEVRANHGLVRKL